MSTPEGGSDYRARPVDKAVFSATDALDALPDTGIPLHGIAPREENERRAHFAAKAVHHYAVTTGVASGESVFLAIGDLMGDLHHLLDALRAVEDDEGHPRSMEELVDRGFRHYRPEISGQP
jgi:hypothetical protein